MASKDAAAPTNADLFGDTDSSDESVGATTTKSTVNNNAPATANDNDDEAAPKKGTHDEETIREDTKMADDSDEDEAEVGQKKYSSSTNDNNNNDNSQKTDNAALFGDDDSSSEDDEFQDDGIIGTTKTGDDANNNTTKDPPAIKTMNQTLGLDSDSDEDDNANMKDGGDDGNEDMKKAVYVPPRKMELLNLHPNKHESSSSNSNNSSTVYHTVKLPNLVGINTTPYNSKTHDAKSEEEYYQGYVHNMIRWRYKYDEDTGELQREEDSDMLVRESNTRLVKWSDGSYTLHVGKEVLEVDNLDSSVPMEGAGGKGGVLPGFSGINGYLYASQKARIRPPTKKELEGPVKTEDDKAENKAAGGEKNENSDNENNDDDEVPPPTQPGGTVLECLGPISSRFAPRPSSLTSSAHRNLTLAVRQRNVKRARIAEIVTDFDPESEKAKRIKSKDDLAKSSRSAARGGAARRSGGGGGGGRRRGMNASYLEDDDDYDGVNLGRLKRQTMRGDRDNYSDEEEELDYGQDSASSEEDEWSKKKTQKRGAAAARAARKESEDDSSEDGEVVFGDDDDDDDEGEALIKKRVNTKAKAVLDDDDDDE